MTFSKHKLKDRKCKRFLKIFKLLNYMTVTILEE